MPLKTKLSLVLLLMALFFLCTIWHPAKAQIPVYKYGFKGDFSIPIVTGSKAYKQIFTGVMDINSAFTFYTKPGIYASLGAHYLQTKSGNSRNFNLGVFEVKHHVLAPNIAIGYQHFTGERVYTGFDISFGKGYGHYSRSLCADSIMEKPSLKQQFYEFKLNTYISFFTDENLSFGVNLGYQMQKYQFDPYPYCFDLLNSSVNKSDIGRINGSIIFGFGFTYHFVPFKKQPIREMKTTETE